MLLLRVLLLVWLVQFGFAATISRFVSLNAHLTGQERTYVEGDPKITHKVVFQINQQDGDSLVQFGELHLGLFGEIVPRTVKNFVELANMTYGFGYQDNTFHRIIQNFMVQAGQFNDPRGRNSIYNDFGSFDDENFEMLHDRLGRLSMANAGKDTNGGGFFITTTEKLPNLDGKHVVFGQLIGGFDTLMKMHTVETGEANKPLKDIVITNAAVFDLFPKAEIVEIESPSSSYSYFLWFLLLVGVGMVYKKWHFKRQLIVDIKDGNFY